MRFSTSEGDRLAFPENSIVKLVGDTKVNFIVIAGSP